MKSPGFDLGDAEVIRSVVDIMEWLEQAPDTPFEEDDRHENRVRRSTWRKCCQYPCSAQELQKLCIELRR